MNTIVLVGANQNMLAQNGNGVVPNVERTIMKQQQFKQIVDSYWKIKTIVDFATSGDLAQDPRGQLIRQSMTIKDVENYQNILRRCEELGIQYCKRSDIN